MHGYISLLLLAGLIARVSTLAHKRSVWMVFSLSKFQIFFVLRTAISKNVPDCSIRRRQPPLVSKIIDTSPLHPTVKTAYTRPFSSW